jgi:hypothetical protein
MIYGGFCKRELKDPSSIFSTGKPTCEDFCDPEESPFVCEKRKLHNHWLCNSEEIQLLSNTGYLVLSSESNPPYILFHQSFKCWTFSVERNGSE